MTNRNESLRPLRLLGNVLVKVFSGTDLLAEQDVVVQSGQVQELLFTLADSSNSLRGRVMERGLYGVSGAQVTVKGRSGSERKTVSETDGRFELRGLGDPPFFVRVDHSEFAQVALSGVRPGDGELVIDLR
ncbi:MAG: carboxypeptidase regulatory-like domain-containing protein [Myxococcales bacterium]|nr:MAG: carboxypeptidase regulatory-like domain-containing protein [Myxococcales bacterium]